MPRFDQTRVLMVDDDDAQRDVVSEILEMDGARVLLASSTDDALRMLQTERPDVVLLDLHGVDSDAVSQALHQRVPRPALVILSGDMKVKDHAQRLGADLALPKPYDLDQLVDAVDEALRRRDRVADDAHPA